MNGEQCFDLGCNGCEECVDDAAADGTTYTVRRPMPGDGGKSEVQRLWWEYWAEQKKREDQPK
jgi:hypothetical protein